MTAARCPLTVCNLPSPSPCPCIPVCQTPAAEFFCHPIPLGDNLYRKDRDRVAPPQRTADDAALRDTSGAASSNGGEQAVPEIQVGSVRPTRQQSTGGAVFVLLRVGLGETSCPHAW